MIGLRNWVNAHRGLSGFVAGAAAVLLLGAGGMAIAAIPSSSDGSITSCVNKTSGAVRIIDAQAGKHCTTKERRVAWSKGYRYRGTWSAGTAYAVLDVVTANGSSYVAKAASTGKTPAGHSALWGLLAAAGARGPAGPGAVAASVHTTTGTFVNQQVAVPGMSLTLEAICGVGSGFSSSVYLTDDDGSQGDYVTMGSYNLTASSSHAFLVHTGATPGPNLALGLGSYVYSQTAGTGTSSEFVLAEDSGSGVGVLTGHAQVTRGTHQALLTFTVSQSPTDCLAQADATPVA